MKRRTRNALVSSLVALSIAPLLALAHQGGPPHDGPPGDPLGPDLFIAIRKNDNAKVKELLAKGAKTDNRNWLDFTPLMWAAMCGNEGAMAALCEAKADIEAPVHYGTAISFAAMSDNPRAVKFLLDRGAKIETGRSDGITPLMLAAQFNRVEVIGWLLEKNADINAVDVEGGTALMWAVRNGHLDAARKLIDAGAKVDATDKHSRTPLMYAAMNGHPKIAGLLLSKGASPTLKDAKGNTAAMLAARYAPDTAGSLKSTLGSAAQVQNPKSKIQNPRLAAERAISLLETSADYFTKNAGCTSCHHQGLGLMVTALAKDRGFRYDPKIVEAEIGALLKEDTKIEGPLKGVLAHPEMYKFVPAVDMDEFSPGVGFMYAGYVAHKTPATEVIRGAAVILASQQHEDGRWGFVVTRAPIQSSQFTTTALAVDVLKAYFPKERAKELDARLARARKWAVETRPATNEDTVFRLLALKKLDAPKAEIDKAVAEVKKLQRKDGGWAQFPHFRSDAYATGTALYALHMGGSVSAKDPSYKKGMDYLLRTQDEDGSWYVNKRAIPANTYFDSTFPHGMSQYASYGGTAWAAMALMLGAEPAQRTAAR